MIERHWHWCMYAVYVPEAVNNYNIVKVEKSSYVLGSELWESKFDGLLSLVKEYIIDVWEI